MRSRFGVVRQPISRDKLETGSMGVLTASKYEPPRLPSLIDGRKLVLHRKLLFHSKQLLLSIAGLDRGGTVVVDHDPLVSQGMLDRRSLAHIVRGGAFC